MVQTLAVSNEALTDSSWKRRQQVEGGCIASEGGVDPVDGSDSAHIRGPRNSVAAESTLVRRVTRCRRQTLHCQTYLQHIRSSHVQFCCVIVSHGFIAR